MFKTINTIAEAAFHLDAPSCPSFLGISIKGNIPRLYLNGCVYQQHRHGIIDRWVWWGLILMPKDFYLFHIFVAL